MGDRSGNGQGDARSASRLDAATRVRALVDVQRRGLLAASELVDRLIRSVDGDDIAAPGGRRAAPPALGPTEELVQLWVDVVRLGLDTFAPFLTPVVEGRAGGATVDLATGASTGVVRLDIVRLDPSSHAGRADRSGVEVWLHNGSGRAYADLRLHCGDLRASDGAVLPATAVRFDPASVALAARSSRGVVVSVDADVPAGTYRGVILAAGVADVWLPVEVAVAADPSEV